MANQNFLNALSQSGASGAGSGGSRSQSVSLGSPPNLKGELPLEKPHDSKDSHSSGGTVGKDVTSNLKSDKKSSSGSSSKKASLRDSLLDKVVPKLFIIAWERFTANYEVIEPPEGSVLHQMGIAPS